MKKVSWLVLSFLIAGCGGIPTSSAIHFGSSRADEITSQFIRVIAQPPVDGMTPQTLVQGFLDACGDSSNDYQVAREYMTGAMASKWNPNSGAQVYVGSTLALTETNDEVSLTAQLDSTISPLGHLSVAANALNVSASFKLNQNEFGQWRISAAPDGLLLSRSDVDRGYRPLPVFFSDPTGSQLVADTIVVPLSSAGAATSVVRSLLSGPSPELAGAVRNNFPTGTRLTFGSVPVNVGIADVDLTQDVLAADATMRKALVAQLVWTLVQLPNVTAVRVLVSGQALDVPGAVNPHTLKEWKAFAPAGISPDASLHVLVGGSIRSASKAQEVSATLVPSLTSTLLSASQDSLSPHFAAVITGGQTLVADFAELGVLNEVFKGESLTRPTWDRVGNIYVADYGTGVSQISPLGEILAVPIDVTINGSGNQVRRIAIAPDGVRVALVFTDGVQDTLAVAALVQENGSARITGVHRIEGQITSVTDLAWSSQIKIQALGSDGTGGQKLFDVGLADGRVTANAVPLGASSIAIDPQGVTYLGVTAATSSNVVKPAFGQWSNVVDGAGPLFAQ
ncbi:unannotated protein [freshwater metagenome]|uniref:Unannotated protein n=1 Tax=freshwater metagenome TaxID=449393 RepID=A0A6J5ZN45_9ZZZZ